MCFSATASFIAGSGLCVAGVFSLSKAPNRSQLPFAAIPLLFGVQQLIEGVLWLTLNGTADEKWLWPSALAFLVFAQIIWPFWVPFAFILPEKSSKRKTFLVVILLLGAILAVYHIYCLAYFPIAVDAHAHHIDYLREFPERPAKVIAAIYIVATILPPFLSSIKGIKVLAGGVLLAFLAALFLYKEFLISVWCMFAAVVSILVIIVLYRQKKEFYKEQ